MSTPQDQIGPRLEDYADDKGNVTLDNYERYLATKHKVPLELAKAIRRGESGGGGHYGGKGGSVVESATAGARGRYQVMPETAKALGITNLDDPAENTRAGIMELRRLHDAASKYTDNDEDRWIYATSGYFGGEGNLKRVATTGQMDRHDYKLDKQGRKVPGTSTFDYVQGVIDRTKQFRAAGEGSDAAEGISNFFTGAAREEKKAPTTAPTPAAAAPKAPAAPAAPAPAAWQGDPREKPLEGSALGEMYRRLAKAYSRGGPAPPPPVSVPGSGQGYNQQKQSVYDFDVSPKEPQKKGGSVFQRQAPVKEAPNQAMLDALNPNVQRGIYTGTPEQQAEVKSGKGRLTQLSQNLKNLTPLDQLKKEKAAQQAAEAQFRKRIQDRAGQLAPTPMPPEEVKPVAEEVWKQYGTPGGQGVTGGKAAPETRYRAPEMAPVEAWKGEGPKPPGVLGRLDHYLLEPYRKGIRLEAAGEQLVGESPVGSAVEAGKLQAHARDYQMLVNLAEQQDPAYKVLKDLMGGMGREWNEENRQKAIKARDTLEAQAYIKQIEADKLGSYAGGFIQPGQMISGAVGVVGDIPAVIGGAALGGTLGSAAGPAGTAAGTLAGITGAFGLRQRWDPGQRWESFLETLTAPAGEGAGYGAVKLGQKAGKYALMQALERMSPEIAKKAAPYLAGAGAGAIEEGIPAFVAELAKSGDLGEAAKSGFNEALLGGVFGAHGGHLAHGSEGAPTGREKVDQFTTDRQVEQQIVQLSEPPPGETPAARQARERQLSILQMQQQRAAGQDTGYTPPPPYGAGQYQGPPGPKAWAPPAPTVVPRALSENEQRLDAATLPQPPAVVAPVPTAVPTPVTEQAAAVPAPAPAAPEGEPSPYEFKGRGPDFLLKPEELAELDQIMAAPEFGKSNKLVNIDEAAQNVRDLWKQIGSSSQTNVGASPEILGALLKLGVGYAEAGIRAFPQWSAAMIKKAQELELPVSWLKSELRGIYSRMGKELGVDLTPPSAEVTEQWELPETDELGLGGMVKRRARSVPQPTQAAAEAETARGRISRPGERPETPEYGQLADRLSDDLPFYGGGRADRSVNLDPDVRSAVAKGLANMRSRGIEPRDNNGDPINISRLNMRIPWEVEPESYEKRRGRMVGVYDPAIAHHRGIGEEALRETHRGLRALMAERLSGQANIESLKQVTPEDYVDWFNDNIPPTSPAWGKLRNAIEAAGLQWPENARKGHYAPEPLAQLPEEIDPTPELSDALQGDTSPLSNEIRRVVGSSVERLDKFSKVYASLGRALAQRHQGQAKELHHKGQRAGAAVYPDKNLMIMTALQAVHEAGGNMEEAEALAPALGRWDTSTGTDTLRSLRRLKTPEAQNVYQAMLGVANSPAPKLDPTGTFVSAINRWIDYHNLKDKRQAGTLEKWLTNKRNASLRQSERSLIQTIDHYASNDSAGLANFMQAMYEVQAIDLKATQEDVVNAAATIQREDELEKQSKSEAAGRGPQGSLPLQVGGAPTGVTQAQPGATAAAQAAAARQQAPPQTTPIGPQRPINYAKRVGPFRNTTAATRLAVFRSEIKHMGDDQLQNLVGFLGEAEPNEDNTVRLQAASRELERRQKEAPTPKAPKQPRQGAPVGQEPKLPVLTFIRRKLGGINIFSTSGDTSEYGGSEIRDIVDVPANRTGGLLNSKGLSPEYARDALVEAGYLSEESGVNEFLDLINKAWSERGQKAQPQQANLTEEEQLERDQFRQSLPSAPTDDLRAHLSEVADSLKIKGQDKEHVRWLDEQRELIRKELTQRERAIKEAGERYRLLAGELQSNIDSLKKAPKGETEAEEGDREARGRIAAAELNFARLEQAEFEARTNNDEPEMQDALAGKVALAGAEVELARDTYQRLQAMQANQPAPPINLKKKRTRKAKAAEPVAEEDIESLYQKAVVALRQGHDIDNSVDSVVDSIVGAGADPKLRYQLLSLLQQRNLITWEDERFAKRPQPHYIRVQDPRLTPEEEPLSPALRQVVDNIYPDIAAQQGAATSPARVASAALKPLGLSQADMLAARRVIMDRLGRAGLTYIEEAAKGGQTVWVKPAAEPTGVELPSRATTRAQNAANRKEAKKQGVTPEPEERMTPMERRESDAARQAREIASRPLDVNEQAELEQKLANPKLYDKNVLMTPERIDETKAKIADLWKDMTNPNKLNMGANPEILWHLTKLGVGIVEAGIRNFPEWAAAMIKQAEELGIENIAWFKAQLYGTYRSTRAYPGLNEVLQEESDKRLRQIEEVRNEIAVANKSLTGEEQTIARAEGRLRVIEASLARTDPFSFKDRFVRRSLELNHKEATKVLEELRGKRSDPVAIMRRHIADTQHQLDMVEGQIHQLAKPLPVAEPEVQEVIDTEKDARQIEAALNHFRNVLRLRPLTEEQTSRQLIQEMTRSGYEFNAWADVRRQTEAGVSPERNLGFSPLSYSVRREAPVQGPPSPTRNREQERVTLEGTARDLRAQLDDQELELRKAEASKTSTSWEDILHDLEENHQQKLTGGFTSLLDAKALSLKWEQRGLYEGTARTDEVHAEILARFKEERAIQAEERAHAERMYGPTPLAREQAEALNPGLKAYKEQVRLWERKRKQAVAGGITEAQFDRTFPPPAAPKGYNPVTRKIDPETHIGQVPIIKPEESDMDYQERKALFDRQAIAHAAMIKVGERSERRIGVVIKSGPNKGKLKIKKAGPGMLTMFANQEELIAAGLLLRAHPEHLGEGQRVTHLGRRRGVDPETGKRTMLPKSSPFAPVGMTVEEQHADLRRAFGLEDDWDRAEFDADEQLIKEGKMDLLLDREVTRQREAAEEGAVEQGAVEAKRRAEKGEVAELEDEEDEDIEPEEESEETVEQREAAKAEAETAAEEEQKKQGKAKPISKKAWAEYQTKLKEYRKDRDLWESRLEEFQGPDLTEEETAQLSDAQLQQREAQRQQAEARFRRTFPKPIPPKQPRLPYVKDQAGVLAEDAPKIVALDGFMQKYAGYLTRLGRLLEVAKKHSKDAAEDSNKATTPAEEKTHRDIWKVYRKKEGQIIKDMKRVAHSLQLIQNKKYSLMGYNVKGAEASIDSLVRSMAKEEGATGKQVYSILDQHGIVVPEVEATAGRRGTDQEVEDYVSTREEDVTARLEAERRGEEPEHMGPGVRERGQLEEDRRAGLSGTKRRKLRNLRKVLSLSTEEMQNIDRPTESQRHGARETLAGQGFEIKPETKLRPAEAEQAARETLANKYGFTPKEPEAAATPAQAFENLFKKPADEQQPSLLDVSDADIQKVRRLERTRAMNAPVTRVFERAEWADDIVNLGTATHEEILGAADITSTPELESLGSYVAQANNAGIAVMEMALEDLGYMNPDADGLAIPLKAVPKLAEALRKYGDAGDFLARYMEAVVRLKEKGHEVYGDRIVLVNAADHIDSQHLYDNVQHELFHLLQFDMASEKDPAGLNRGQFVMKDPDYPVLVKAFKALGENTSSANIEIEAAGYIASGDWKAMGFQSADHAKAYLKRYIRHLVREYGIDKLAKWPLMAVKGSTVAQAIREVQNEAKRNEKTKQKRKADRTAAEEARAQAAAELGIELSEGTRGGEGGRPGSKRVVPELTKEQRKARYDKRRAELAKLTPEERQAKRERARELREEAKEWRESLSPEEQKAAWLARRDLIKNMAPEEKADYDAAREDQRKNFREQLKQRKGWEAEERTKEAEAKQKAWEEGQPERDRAEAARIARNMELYGTPEDPTKPVISSGAGFPPIINDPKHHPAFQPVNNTENRWWWRMAEHLWPDMGKDPMVRNGDLSALDMEEGKGGDEGLNVGAKVDPRAKNKGWRKFAQVRQTVLLASFAFLETNLGTAFSTIGYEYPRSFVAEFFDRMFFSKGDITKRVIARVWASDIGEAHRETRRMMREGKDKGLLYKGPKRGAAARMQGGLPFEEFQEPQFKGLSNQLTAEYEETESNWSVYKPAQRQKGETRRAWLARRTEQAITKADKDRPRMEWGNVSNFLFEELLRKANQIPDTYGYSVHFLAHAAALTRLLEKKVEVRTERAIKEAESKAGRTLTAADPEYQKAMKASELQAWETTEIMDQAGAIALDNAMRGRNFPAMLARTTRMSIAGWFEGMVRPNARQPWNDAMKRATNAADYVGNLSFWRIPMGMVHKAGKMTVPFGFLNVGTMYWKWQWAERRHDQQVGRYKAQFIDAISDMVVGTGLVATPGFLLGVMGMASGGAKDWEEEEAMRAQGIPPFSINLSSFGRAHRAFWGDWKALRHQPGDIYWRGTKYVAPLALAFEMGMGAGAALRKTLDGQPMSYVNYIDAVTLQPTKAMATSLQEITALDRIFSDILRASSHAEGAWDVGVALGKGVAQQVVGFGAPAQAVHIKRVLDKYERESRGEKGGWLGDMFRKPMSKLPGASELLPIKKNVYGQAVETEPGMPLWTRFFPGNFSRYKGDPIIEAGLKNEKLPGRVKLRGEKMGQPAETMEHMRQRGEDRGQRMLNAGSVITATEEFKALPKVQQDYILAEIYDRAGDPQQEVTLRAMMKSLGAAQKRGPGASKGKKHIGF